MDLLSAALNESGIAEELEEFNSSGFDSSITSQQQNYSVSTTPNATFVPPDSSIRVLQQQSGIRAAIPQVVQSVAPVNTAANQPGLRRVVIRAPVNHATSQVITRPVAPLLNQQGAPRFVTLSAGRNSPQPRIMGANGPVRIIRLGKADTGNAQPKVVKIMKTSTGTVVPVGNIPQIKRIVVNGPRMPVASSVTPVTRNDGLVQTSVGLRPVSVCPQVTMNMGTMPVHSVPSTRFNTTALPVGALRNVVRKPIPGVRPVIRKVGPREAENGPRFKQSIRTYSKQSPVVPAVSSGATGNTVSTVATGSNQIVVQTLPINHSTSVPSLAVSSVSNTVGSIRPSVTHSAPVSIVTSNSVNKPIDISGPVHSVNAIVVPSQSSRNTRIATVSLATVPATTPNSTVTIVSQNDISSQVTTQASSNIPIATSSSSEPEDSSKQAIEETEPSEPPPPAAPSFDEVMRMEEERLRKLAEKNAASTASAVENQSECSNTQSRTTTPTLDFSENNHSWEIDKQMESNASDTKDVDDTDTDSDFFSKFEEVSAKADWQSIKQQLEAQLFQSETSDSAGIEPKDTEELKTQDPTTKLESAIKTENSVTIKEEPMDPLKEEVQEEIKAQPFANPEIKEEISEDKSDSVKSKTVIKTETMEFKFEIKSEPENVVKVEADSKPEVMNESEKESQPPLAKKAKHEEPVEENSPDPDDFGGGDFFQALAELQTTNQKAKEFESKVKAASETTTGTTASADSKPVTANTSDLLQTALATSGNAAIVTENQIQQTLPASSHLAPSNIALSSSGLIQVQMTSGQTFPSSMSHTILPDLVSTGRTVAQQSQQFVTTLGSTPSGTLTQVRMPSGVVMASPLADNVITRQLISVPSAPTLGGVSVGGVSVGGVSVITAGRAGSPLTVQRTVMGTSVRRAGSPLTVIQHGISTQQGGAGGTPSILRVISSAQNFQQGTRIVSSPDPSTVTPQRVNMMSMTGTERMPYAHRQLNVGESGANLQRMQSPYIQEVQTTPRIITDKDVSRIWANEDIKLKSIQSEPNFVRSGSPMMPGMMPGSMPGVSQQQMMLGGAGGRIEEEAEEEEQELGVADTYADYMPSKSKIGCRHPDTVVETSSLSSVEAPDIHYKLSIPEHIIDQAMLSALQLETIIYASQKHNTFLPSGHRAGFLVGDGAGVGKGRTIAGFIYENYLQGRKRSLWLSVSNDLRVDAERDLRDIGASRIEVHPLNKFKYAKISSSINGKVKKGVIFSTYSALIGESSAGGKYRTRFKQLMHWLGKDFDGLLVFDECHRAKNLCPAGSSKPTKTGLTVLELQNRLPMARVVYASATGASEPRNMAYMTRLGLWGPGTPFPEFMDFIQAVEKRGVGAMELVAMDMKLRGTYIARQLSFHGVQFKVETVPIDEKLVDIYNRSVKLWVEAREAFSTALELMGSEQRSGKTAWGQFWSAHQRFFKYLCISAKMDHCVKLARDAIKSGKCVVIGLQSTGEARTQEALEEFGEINDFVSTAKGVFQSMVEKHFPAPNKKRTFDLMSLFDDDETLETNKHGKRKQTFAEMCDVKRRHEDWSSDSGGSGSDSNSNSDTNNEPNNKTNKKRGGGRRKKRGSNKHRAKSAAVVSKVEKLIAAKKDKSSSESGSKSDSGGSDSGKDDSDKNGSGSDSGGSEEEDFNPFGGGGSDSDDDPWLKRTKAKKAKKAKKKKKKKDKKESNEDGGKKHGGGKKRKRENGSDGSDEDFDDKFDKILQASGLKPAASSDDPGSQPALATGADDEEKASKLRTDLLLKIERLGEILPPNALDQLIDDLGGTDNVAEMTGRKGRVVSDENGAIHYESRSESDVPLEILNLAEKQRFMDGEKLIAVISEAASSGISLQADRRVNNQRRRVHITLELPWSADRAIQQFGRTHRSNQVSAPQYIFLISDLAGERRFASTVSKRLESLGALTHGDRRATESRDLSQFNIDNKYGKTALEVIMRSIAGLDSPLVPPPKDYPGNFLQDARQALVGVGLVYYNERCGGFAQLDKDYNNISKFLNRLLGTEVQLQNALFRYFTETLTAICLQAKRNGRWDLGILDLGAGSERIKLLSTKSFVGTFSGTATKIEIHTISCERGMTYSEALKVWHEHSAPDDGFYVGTDEKNGHRGVILAVQLQGKRSKHQQLFNVYKPNSGLQGRTEQLKTIKAKYRKSLPDTARRYWEEMHAASATQCSHAFWKGMCRRASLSSGCEVGLRQRTYYVLSGSVLSVWNTVERVLLASPGTGASRMQVIRLRTDENKRIVGMLIPMAALSNLELVLSQESRTYDTHHAPNSVEAGRAAALLGNGSPATTQQLLSNTTSSGFAPGNVRVMHRMPMSVGVAGVNNQGLIQHGYIPQQQFQQRGYQGNAVLNNANGQRTATVIRHSQSSTLLGQQLTGGAVIHRVVSASQALNQAQHSPNGYVGQNTSGLPDNRVLPGNQYIQQQQQQLHTQQKFVLGNQARPVHRSTSMVQRGAGNHGQQQTTAPSFVVTSSAASNRDNQANAMDTSTTSKEYVSMPTFF